MFLLLIQGVKNEKHNSHSSIVEGKVYCAVHVPFRAPYYGHIRVHVHDHKQCALNGILTDDGLLPTNCPAYSHPCGTPLHLWSMDDVGQFLTSLGYEAYVDKFVEHEIDGKALSLVKDHHLLMTMKLRLGPTLKICEHVSAIRAIEDLMEDS